MLTKENVFNISREGYALLDSSKPSIGRSLRRFLSRVSADGLVLQVFTDYEDEIPEAGMARCSVYAEKIRNECNAFIQDEWGTLFPCGDLVTDQMFSLVENSYKLNCNISTASVAQLLEAVRFVVFLSDSMHRFAGDPDSELGSVNSFEVATMLSMIRRSERSRFNMSSHRNSTFADL